MARSTIKNLKWEAFFKRMLFTRKVTETEQKLAGGGRFIQWKRYKVENDFRKRNVLMWLVGIPISIVCFGFVGTVLLVMDLLEDGHSENTVIVDGEDPILKWWQGYDDFDFKHYSK